MTVQQPWTLSGAGYPLLLLLMLTTGCASYKPGISDAAQGADGITTAIGIYGSALAEANPVLADIVIHPAGMVAVAGTKLYMAHAFRKMPSDQCRMAISAATGLGAGAALSNIVVIAGASTGPVLFVPAATLFMYLSYRSNAVRECEGGSEGFYPGIAER